MGFSFYYRSTRPITPTEAANIERAAANLTRGHTWLSCEPVSFYAAAKERLPDGTAQDLFDIRCQLSHSNAIDWEISHDFSDGPVGFIRNGIRDREVLTQAEALTNVEEMLGNIMGEFESPGGTPSASSSPSLQ